MAEALLANLRAELEVLERRNNELRYTVSLIGKATRSPFKRRISFGEVDVNARPDLGDPLDLYVIKPKNEIAKPTASFAFYKKKIEQSLLAEGIPKGKKMMVEQAKRWKLEKKQKGPHFQVCEELAAKDQARYDAEMLAEDYDAVCESDDSDVPDPRKQNKA